MAEIPPSLQVESQLAFIRDSLKLIKRLWLHLYHHDNLSSVTWDPTHTEHFLTLVHRLHLEVRGCVSRRLQQLFDFTSTLGLDHCPLVGGCLAVSV